MENPILAALAISLLGMPLLFLALGLFYGLLTLLTSTVRDRAAQPAAQPAPEAADEAHEPRLRAAALAVALARARAEPPGTIGELSAEATPLSAWWALHHGRKLAPGADPRRGR